MNPAKLNKLILGALFAALTCIATMIIHIPTIGTGGYVNVGDSIVLLSAWMLGGPYGALAAGLGSGLADFLSGYPIYTPGTFIIKFLMCLAAYYIFRMLNRLNLNKVAVFAIGGIISEAIMVIGYLIYEAAIIGYGLAAAASVPSNILQGCVNIIIGYAVMQAMTRAKVLTPAVISK